MFFVEFLSPAGGANQPAGPTGEVMPWTSGKIRRFCFASWGFARKITERKNGPIQIHRKNGFGVSIKLPFDDKDLSEIDDDDHRAEVATRIIAVTEQIERMATGLSKQICADITEKGFKDIELTVNEDTLQEIIAKLTG
jgi:hypothetical protein